jgi:hypothetical protein
MTRHGEARTLRDSDWQAFGQHAATNLEITRPEEAVTAYAAYEWLDPIVNINMAKQVGLPCEGLRGE